MRKAQPDRKPGRPRLPLPKNWEKAVAAYEKGARCQDVAAMLGGMTQGQFYGRYRLWCDRVGRKPKRVRPKRQVRVVYKPKEPVVTEPPKLLPDYPVKEKPTMSYYLSDEGMREFLKEGSGLAIQCKECAKHGLDLQEGEILRKKLRLKARDFLRLMQIAREVG